MCDLLFKLCSQYFFNSDSSQLGYSDAPDLNEPRLGYSSGNIYGGECFCLLGKINNTAITNSFIETEAGGTYADAPNLYGNVQNDPRQSEYTNAPAL